MENNVKKLYEMSWQYHTKDANIVKLTRERKQKRISKKIKKFLTSDNEFGNIKKLSLKSETENLDNWTIDNDPWKFLRENSKNGLENEPRTVKG